MATNSLVVSFPFRRSFTAVKTIGKPRIAAPIIALKSPTISPRANR